MSLRAIHKCLINNFISWGWLSPAFFPVLEAIGRAPFNVCIAIYLAWGALFLSERGFGGDRRTFVLYVVLLFVFCLSLINAVNIYKGAYTLVKYSFVTLTYFMTSHVLLEDEKNWKRQFKCFAVAGVLTVIALAIRGGIMSDWQRLVPVRGMFERNLPFLLPFLLFALKSIPQRVVRWFSYIAASAVFASVIVFSGGRSALVGLIASLALYGLLGFRLKWRYVLLTCVLVVLGAAMLGGPKGVLVTRGLSLNSSIDLDRLSTGRTYMWRQALEHPPANQLLGVGMNNVRYYDEVVFIKNVEGMGDQKVKGLHNFIIDLWYETGFLGLVAYLVFMASFVVPPLYKWGRFSPEHRIQIAPVLTAVFAIFTAACTSISYFSPQMSGYLFFLLASLKFFSSEEIRSSTMPYEQK